jgi:putative chitinase
MPQIKIQNKMSLIKLQEKLGLKPDGNFGSVTLKAAAEYFKLTPERAAHFFGQTAHETGNFKTFTENLNYSADGLKRIFSKYFPGNLADLYARQPEKIANRVYASRMGNGDEKSGDGWKYRGRGALQLTGKDNYIAFANFLKKEGLTDQDIMLKPDLVTTDFSFESALFFFNRNKLWDIADKGVDKDTILAITKRINGGTHGLDDRTIKTNTFFELLKK